MDTDLSAYKDLYIQTAQDYAAKIKQAAEQLKADLTNKEAIDLIHLSAHSLKSQSHAMKYETTAEMFMHLEKIFANIQKGSANVTSELVSETLLYVDDFISSLENIKQSGQEKNMTDHTQSLKKYL